MNQNDYKHAHEHLAVAQSLRHAMRAFDVKDLLRWAVLGESDRLRRKRGKVGRGRFCRLDAVGVPTYVSRVSVNQWYAAPATGRRLTRSVSPSVVRSPCHGVWAH